MYETHNHIKVNFGQYNFVIITIYFTFKFPSFNNPTKRKLNTFQVLLYTFC